MSTQSQEQFIMMQFPCSTCKTPVMGKQPKLRVFNSADVSIIAATHTSLSKCPQCGTVYVCLFHPQAVDAEGKIMFMWTPVQTKESAIVPGNDNSMKQAIKQDEALKDIEGKLKLN